MMELESLNWTFVIDTFLLLLIGIGPKIALVPFLEATKQMPQATQRRVLRKMLTTISRPNKDISAWAPRLLRTHIPPDKIGALIGPGGKTIRSIQEQTGAVLEVEDDGTVTIASSVRPTSLATCQLT